MKNSLNWCDSEKRKMILISDSDDDDLDEAKPPPAYDVVIAPPKEASEAGPSHTNWTLSRFIAMGFPEKMVAKAIKQNGDQGNPDGILETLLAYSGFENSPSRHDRSLVLCSLASDKGTSDDDFKFEDCNDDFSEKDAILSILVDMGFLAKEASSAIDRCGPNTPISELVDSIHAAQMQGDSDDQLWDWPESDSDNDDDDDNESYIPCIRKKKSVELEREKKRPPKSKLMKKPRQMNEDDAAMVHIPRPMVGFGLPFEPPLIAHRNIPEAAIGPPFFYYENVALATKGAWDRISRFLYDIEPEFVDSKFFCAAARKRGYVHNLPITNRFPLLPIPPKTIQEAFPITKKWWPSWDPRTQLNCLVTSVGSAQVTERIRVALTGSDDPPPDRVKKYVLKECRYSNLIWIGLHKVAVLEPDEMEKLLGFPKNHTRGISRTERYKSLGNSFQVDTVAYHLSVLKDMFPNGITVLSLFSGIGGAEVALHRLGIRLKAVVSVELSEKNRSIVKGWWEQTNQTGTLIHEPDVQQLNGDRLEHYINMFGGFDLVIGGSPCNNLAGRNRFHRDGLEGEQSELFYDYYRILDLVKCIMGRN